jgi:hypothetical protein
MPNIINRLCLLHMLIDGPLLEAVSKLLKAFRKNMRDARYNKKFACFGLAKDCIVCRAGIL